MIESLRAFDLVFITNSGLNGLELLSVLVTNNIIGEASRVGFGSALAVILLVISVGPDHPLPVRARSGRRPHDGRRRSPRPSPPRGPRPGAASVPHASLLHAFLIATSLVWLFPIVWAVYTSLRPYADTATLGYVSIGGTYNFDNFIDAWNSAEHRRSYFLNTLIIVVPAVILVLLLASMVAFAVSRYSWRFNLGLLMLFTAGNLLPQQVIITPLYRIYLALPLPRLLSDNGLFYDQYIGIIAIHIAFQLGFCTFVLSNYMKTIPKELNEAAVVDGAGVLRTFWDVILPLLPAAAGGPRDAPVHLDLQRLLLGPHPDVHGRQAADHLRPQPPERPVLHRQQPRRCGLGHRRHAHPDRLLRPPEAVHQRPDARLDQGLSERRIEGEPALGRPGPHRPRPAADARGPAPGPRPP